MWFHLLPDSRALLLSKGVFHQMPGVALVSLDLPFTPEYEKPLPNPLVPESFINGQG